MKLLAHILCLCLALALTRADRPEEDGTHAHSHDHTHPHSSDHALDRCQGLEMDAVTVNENGVPYFFKGNYLFKGFDGHAELSNQTFSELDDYHHLGYVDAAFRMYNEENPLTHDRLFFFLDYKVFSFYQHKLEEGFPKNIPEVFPGVPDHLDAAVECPKEDCDEDKVIFFKGHDILHYNLKTMAVDMKEFDSMPNCTSAFRFMGHYYCFHGHMFSKFDPKTGFVHGKYPKEARDYFMRCSKFSNDSDHVEREQCSRVHLDAVTADGAGNMYAFRGHYFLFKDENTLTVDTIESAFKELQSGVDAVFTYQDQLHMIKDDHMFVYKGNHTLVDGYPKPLSEVLGFNGPVDAAFVCDEHVAHVIKGPSMISVNLLTTPYTSIIEHPIFSFNKVDAVMCHGGGVKVIVGNHFYHFGNPMEFVTGVPAPKQHKVSMELFGCDH